MAKRNKRGSKANATGRNTSDRFVLLAHYMLRSPAWKTLSPNAKALLIDVWSRHNGANNGAIAYAVREAEEIGLSKDQASRAFKELTERGFIKMHRASTFNLKTKEARTWELTAEPTGSDGQTPASKDFMRWAGNRTQSHQQDGQSHQRDTSAPDERKLPVSVAPARPSRPIKAPSQSHQRDTYNIPHGAGETDAVIASTATPEPAEHHPDLDQQQPTIAAGRQRRRRQQDDGRDNGTVDIEDLLKVMPNPKLGPAPTSPTDRLRTDLTDHIDRAPKGETKRIAARLGLSGPQISNFKAGRFGLNPTAAATLRQILSEGMAK